MQHPQGGLLLPALAGQRRCRAGRGRAGAGVVIVIGAPSIGSGEVADGGLGGGEQGAVSDDAHDGLDLGGEEAVGAGPWATARTDVRDAAPVPAAGVSGARRSRARAAVSTSMASTRVSASTERRSLRAADQPIETWSSCIARGRDRVDARRDREPLHLADHRRPGCTGRSCGRSRRRGRRRGTAAARASGPASSNRSVRRSLIEARSAAAIARKSSTKATGAPWKLPLDSTRPSGERPPGCRSPSRSSRSATQRGVGERVARGAVHLRGAAQRVGVLHLGVVRRGGCATIGEPASRRACWRRERGLARVRAQGLQVGGEHAVGAEQRLDAHRRRRGRRRWTSAREVVAGEHEHAEHAVGAVDEGEALLRGQHVPARARPRRARRRRRCRSPCGVAHLALADEGQRAVRERREVAGAPERAVLADDRGDAGVEQRGVGLDDLRRARPVWPVARVRSRSSISARTTSRSTSAPVPAACERIRERCSCSRCSVGMWRVASAPKPVETP